MGCRVAVLVGIVLCVPMIGAAQSAEPQLPQLTIDFGPQDAFDTDSPQPPIANEPKPTRNFPSALIHNLGDDFKHMPRRNSLFWLAGGAAAALAVHPLDDNVHEHFLATGDENTGFWKAGEIIGETPTILGAALGDLYRRTSEAHATGPASRHGRARGRNSLGGPGERRQGHWPAQASAQGRRHARVRLLVSFRARHDHLRGGDGAAAAPWLQGRDPDLRRRDLRRRVPAAPQRALDERRRHGRRPGRHDRPHRHVARSKFLRFADAAPHGGTGVMVAVLNNKSETLLGCCLPSRVVLRRRPYNWRMHSVRHVSWAIVCVAMVTSWTPARASAETGSDAWLRYAPLSEPAATRYREVIPASVAVLGDQGPVVGAGNEMVRGLRGMLGRLLRLESALPKESAIVLGTRERCRSASPALYLDGTLGDEAYRLKTVRVGNVQYLVVTGDSDRAVLYGAFALLRKVALGQPLSDLDEQQGPDAPIRWVNQWDNLDGTIERGYGGRSIFWENGHAATGSLARQRLRPPARVGRDQRRCRSTTSTPIRRVLSPDLDCRTSRAIADALRPWGVRDRDRHRLRQPAERRAGCRPTIRSTRP